MSIEAIANLPPLRDVIDEHELRATKALGQNFLLDLNLTRKIARVADIGIDDHIIEIGPGPGGLTRGILLEGAKNLIAIEFDPRAVNALQSLNDAANGILTILHDDALKMDMMTHGHDGSRKIIANLPYNIATPLLIGWLKQIHDHGNNAYQSITVMVQKEVAERICAPFGSKQYGRLTVLTQWLCDCRIEFDVPRTAFVPPPKVTSSIIHLTPKKRDDDVEFETIEKLTAAAFGQRRKTIRQSLKPFREALHTSGLDTQLRAENLSVANFIQLANCL
jgi:16S rRNA (adenine1518-N6/adenine1519-N6)-dimethyltransferase